MKGKYAGMEGWLNTKKKSNKNSFYRSVIVKLEDEDGEEERVKATRVKRNSIRDLWPTTITTYEEAALQQNPDIERAMIELAEMFAQCGVTSNNGFLRLFDKELTRARTFQNKLGHKGRYRYIFFGNGDRENGHDVDLGDEE